MEFVRSYAGYGRSVGVGSRLLFFFPIVRTVDLGLENHSSVNSAGCFLNRGGTVLFQAALSIVHQARRQ
jgi:hypothetical protein